MAARRELPPAGAGLIALPVELKAATFVLIHSPVAGPLTWEPVEDCLKSAGLLTVRPRLGSMWSGRPPYWSWMADRVLEALGDRGGLIIVGHSGSGARLHPVAQRLGARVVGAVYCDCQLPGLLSTPRRLASQAVRLARADHGRVPSGPEIAETEAMLANSGLRQAFLDEMEADWPAEFVSETVPDAGWPSCPSAYLKLSSGYPESVTYALANGWPLGDPGRDNHLLMVLEPDLVTEQLTDLGRRLISLRQASLGSR